MQSNRKQGLIERNGRVNGSAQNMKHTIQNLNDSSHIQSFISEQESEGEPAFDTKNYLFELQSRCNTLQYQKTKITMAHQNLVNELRHKKDFFQQLSENLSLENQQLVEQVEGVKSILNQVREQNMEFSKEINFLKTQLQRLHQAQMENQSGEQQDVDRWEVGAKLIQKIREVENKDQEIGRLERELGRCNSTGAKVESSLNYRQALSKVQKQRNGLIQKLQQAKQQIVGLQQKSKQLINAAGGQQVLQKQIQEKQEVLIRLEKQNASLKVQVDKLREGAQLVESRSVLGHSEQMKRMKEMMGVKEQQLLQTENEVISLENRVGELQVEMHRVKCQKNGVEQYNKYLQKNNLQNQEKRKEMQQQIYASEKKISELKAFIFSEKLSTQKTINNLKLQFEQQKIRHIEEIDEKSKEIYRLKEITLSNKRDNKDLEETNAKVKTLSKITQENGVLKSQNHVLRQKLKGLQQKQQKMNLQQSLEQRRIRSELQKRVESLEKQIQKLKIENLQFQHLKPYSNYQGSILQPSRKAESNSHLIEALQLSRADKKEKQQLIRMFTTTIKEKQQDYLQQNESMRSLNNELKEMKDHLLRNSINEEKLEERNRVIRELENGIVKINDELRRQKANGERYQKELLALQRKYDLDVEQCEERSKRLKRQMSDLAIRLTHHQNEIIKKDTLISVKQNQIRELTKNLKQEVQQKQLLKTKGDSMQRTITELQKGIEQIRKDKDKLTEELKKQLKLTAQLKLQRQQKINSKWSSKNEEEQTSTIDHLKQMIVKMQKQNYVLKNDYSQSLSEVNHLLIKFRNLEQQFKKKHSYEDRLRQQSNDIQVANIRTQQLQRQSQQNKLMISNYEIQIKRLNQILIQKEIGLTRQASHSVLLHPKVFPRYVEEKLEKNEKSFFLRKKTEHEKKNDLFMERTAKSFCLNNK